MSEPTGDPVIDPGVANKLTYALVGISLALAASDFLYHKHGHYDFEQWPAFYAWFGALSCLGLVFGAAVLRRVVMRDEEYYERD